MSYFQYNDRGEGIEEIANEFANYFGCKVSYIPKNDITFKKDGRVFYCYPAYDIAISGKHTGEIEKFIKRGFCGAVTDWKSVIRNLYYICSRFVFPLSASGMIIIENAPSNSRELMLFPNNKKIKIVDFSNNTIYNILKNGYSRKWYDKEVSFRSQNAYKHVLPLTVNGERSYAENFIKGYTFARLPKKLFQKYENTVTDILNYFSSFDSSEKSVLEYVQTLTNKYLQYKTELSKKMEFDSLDQIWDSVLSVISDNKSILKIGLSHGDIQRGNILLENETENIWILDWETYDLRSISYDALCWKYRLKDKRIQLKKLSEILEENSLNLDTTDNKTLSDNDLVSTIGVYILEDILLILDEASVLPSDFVPETIAYYNSNKEAYCTLLTKNKSNGLVRK